MSEIGDDQPVSGSILVALADELGEMGSTKIDGTLIALARRYSIILDQAEANAAAFAEIDFAAIGPIGQRTWRRIEALEAKTRVETVHAEIGPKLLAALKELQMTRAARDAVKGGGASVQISGSADEDRARAEFAGLRAVPVVR